MTAFFTLELHYEELGLCGRFHSAVGLSGELCFEAEEDGLRALRLQGRLVGPLLSWANDRTRWRAAEAGPALLRVVDATGRPFAEYCFGIVEPHACFPLQGTSTDVELIASVWERPHLPAETIDIWRIWAAGPPSAPNAWSELSFHHRRAWLDVLRHSPSVRCEEPANIDSFVVDGRYVTDCASAYLAIGEAIRGPGGYFGRCLDSLADCLRGGFGARPPFSLRWEHSAVARTSLPAASLREAAARATTAHELAIAGRPPAVPFFDALIQILEEASVTVTLA